VKGSARYRVDPFGTHGTGCLGQNVVPLAPEPDDDAREAGVVVAEPDDVVFLPDPTPESA
jgi:hypothetical protein